MKKDGGRWTDREAIGILFNWLKENGDRLRNVISRSSVADRL